MELSQEPDLSQLIGLNDPIDQQWNERRKLQKQNSTLNERRQQLKEMKQQYLQESVKPQQVAPVTQQKSQSKLQIIINKEIAYQFQQGIEKFKEKSTRDQGITICKRLIESNRDITGVYTLLDVLNSSSKKQIDPKTNNTNILSLDLELITLSEIIKQNQDIILGVKDKICEIALRHLNTDSESTLQAISSVFINLIEVLQIEQISKILIGQLTNKSTQNQSIGVLCIIFYYVYQKQNQEQIKLLASKIVDAYQKILLESLELLNCIELIISNQILEIEPKEYILKTLKYCQQPINKTAIYYLIVVQACKILQILGGLTRFNQTQVLFELNKLSSDRRVAVQMAAKAALIQWRDQDMVSIQNNQQILEKCFQKINFTNIQYQDYQQKGFTSLMRASTFVRKGSGSPTVRRQETTRSQTPKQIRQKIKRIRTTKPTEYQLLPEEKEQVQERKYDEELNQETKLQDSLEKIPLDNIQELNEDQQQSQKISINSIRMPTVKHIDSIPDLQKSIKNQIQEEQPVEEKKQSEGKQQEKQDQIQELVIQNQNAIKVIKVASQNKNNLNQEIDIQYEEISSNYLNQPIQQVNKFEESFSFQFQEIKSKNNKINYDGEDSLVIENKQNVFEDSLEQNLNPQFNNPENLQEKYFNNQNFQKVKQEKLGEGKDVIKEFHNEVEFDEEIQQDIKQQIQAVEQVDKEQQQQKMEQKLKQEKQDTKKQDKADLNQKYDQNQNQKIELKDKVVKVIDKEKPNPQMNSNHKEKVQLNTETNQLQESNKFSNKLKQSPKLGQQQNQGVIKIQNESELNGANQKVQQQQLDIKNNDYEEQEQEQQQQDLNQTLEQAEDAELIQISQQLKMDSFYFKKSLQQFQSGNIDGAYSSIMDNCDYYSLIRFMMITGPCISKLSQRNINRIIERLSFINKQEVLNQQTLILCQQIIDLQLLQELNLEQIGHLKSMIGSCSQSQDQFIREQGYDLFQHLQF